MADRKQVIVGKVHRVGGPLFMVKEGRDMVGRLWAVGDLLTGYDDNRFVKITVEVQDTPFPEE
jgi:hypothetical protein